MIRVLRKEKRPWASQLPAAVLVSLVVLLLTERGNGESNCTLPSWLPVSDRTCRHDPDCQWVRCDDADIQGGIALTPCSSPPSITLWLHSPTLSPLTLWNVTLRDGDEVPFPPQVKQRLFPQPKAGNNLTLRVSLRPGPSPGILLLPAMDVKGCEGESCTVVEQFQMPAVASRVCPSCQLADPFSCGNGFTCQQVGNETDSSGRCLCLSDAGLCPPLVLGVSGRGPDTPSDNNGNDRTFQGTAVGGVVAAVIIVLVLLSGLVVGGLYVRRRGWPHWLRRTQAQTDQLPIGGPSGDDDDDSPIS